MLYWRAKIGLICPGPAVTAENDFNRYAPEGVGISSMHIPWGAPGNGPTPERLKCMAANLEEGCRSYLDARVQQDVIIFGCTSGSFIGGPTFDKECIQLIERTTGTKGLTTSTAILESLRRLGAEKVALITPYPDATNEAERLFLEKNGVEVTSLADMNPQRQFIPSLDPVYVYSQAKKLDKTGADALFVSCTGLNCMGMIREMEEDFGLPVITSNQASLWASLRMARVGAKIDGLGRLFTL